MQLRVCQCDVRRVIDVNNNDNNNNHNNDNNDNNNHNNSSNAFQLMMSHVRAGQVLSFQSSLSCASLYGLPIRQV